MREYEPEQSQQTQTGLLGVGVRQLVAVLLAVELLEVLDGLGAKSHIFHRGPAKVMAVGRNVAAAGSVDDVIGHKKARISS